MEHALVTFFGMTDEVWRRHANPWSVWTRYLAGPILILAVWSRFWIEWWALLPIGLMILWIWLNPRVFSVPNSTENWASRAVLGERIWLNRKNKPIAPQFLRPSHLANGVGALGLIALVWGLVVYSVVLTVGGLLIVLIAKTWFLNKMVALYLATAPAERPV